MEREKGDKGRQISASPLKKQALHDRDGSQPTAAGTWFAACAFFATLFGRPRRGHTTAVPALTAPEVRLLQ